MKSYSLPAIVIFLLLPGLISAADMQQKLYVLSSAGNDVTVIDVATNTIIGSIEVGDRPHGIATTGAFDVLYVATEFDNGMTKIDPVKDVVI
jgi:YVTN family beta-propeller protein